MTSHRQVPDLGELRRTAARRRAIGDRVRRLLPGIIVGSTTLVGSGALAAWVSGQPGVSTTGGHVTARAAASRASTPPTTDPLRSLQQALRADEAALRSLESAMPAVGAAPATPATLPPIVPLPQITVPVAPRVVVAPAPAVNATTGASHAVP